MIDEDRTMQLFGYTSNELAPKSHKKIVVVCSECGVYRVVRKQDYHGLCLPCAHKNRPPHSEETRRKISKATKNPSMEIRRKISEARKGKMCTEETRRRISEAKKGKPKSEETRIKMSCAKQGIKLDDWDGFAVESHYCPKFDNACRERNREKYGRQCFICGKTEAENGRKLSVHHVDMNKAQGCDNHVWQLVPVCMSHHGRSHNDVWQGRLMYLLNRVW